MSIVCDIIYAHTDKVYFVHKVKRPTAQSSSYFFRKASMYISLYVTLKTSLLAKNILLLDIPLTTDMKI